MRPRSVPRLVGELAEVDLVPVRRRRQHLNVGAGAEHLVDSTGHDHRLDLRMLEAHALHDVVQLDVDAQVVGVELQLIVTSQTGTRRHSHGDGRDSTVEGSSPMAVGSRLRTEADQFLRGHLAPFELGRITRDPQTTTPPPAPMRRSTTGAHPFSTMGACIRCQPASPPVVSRRSHRVPWHSGSPASNGCPSHRART